MCSIVYCHDIWTTFYIKVKPLATVQKDKKTIPFSIK